MSKNLSKMSKKVLAILSAGSEEMEFTITVDILRRAGVSIYNIMNTPTGSPNFILITLLLTFTTLLYNLEFESI